MGLGTLLIIICISAFLAGFAAGGYFEMKRKDWFK